MAEPFIGTMADLIFNPKGSLGEQGYVIWHCAAHSRRKQFAQLEMGEVVFTVEQFKSYHPDGFRNSMAAVEACKKIVAALLADSTLYYNTEISA